MVNSDPNSRWSVVDGAASPAARIEFDDLEFLAEVTHPVRGRIARRLKNPHTIAEVAEALDVPVTRLYHHFNKLEEAGIIRVVATRKVTAVTERRYQVVAHGFGVAQRFFESHDPSELSAALGSLFDFAKLGLQREVESGSFPTDRDDGESVLSYGQLTLTAKRHRELVARLEAVVDEFTSDDAESDPDAVRLALFVSAYPETT